METHSIILFDGVCNFCEAGVVFLIKRDLKAIFKFAALQSDAGQRLLKEFNLPTENLSTFVLIDDGRCYFKSTAALRVMTKLGGFWSLLSIFILIPKPLRDLFYRFVAANRYRLFGKKGVCMVPSKEIQERFLS